LVILNDRGSASNLKYNKVMIYTIDPNILLCPLNAMSVAAEIRCREAKQATWTHPTGKGLGFHSHRIVPPPVWPERTSPTLIVQFWGAAKIAALKHYHLHACRDLFSKLAVSVAR
jgi:hypothetical protein